MAKNKPKTYTKPELIAKLKEISAMGFIPNARKGNAGGIGNTLEDLSVSKKTIYQYQTPRNGN